MSDRFPSDRKKPLRPMRSVNAGSPRIATPGSARQDGKPVLRSRGFLSHGSTDENGEPLNLSRGKRAIESAVRQLPEKAQEGAETKAAKSAHSLAPLSLESQKTSTPMPRMGPHRKGGPKA